MKDLREENSLLFFSSLIAMDRDQPFFHIDIVEHSTAGALLARKTCEDIRPIAALVLSGQPVVDSAGAHPADRRVLPAGRGLISCRLMIRGRAHILVLAACSAFPISSLCTCRLTRPVVRPLRFEHYLSIISHFQALHHVGLPWRTRVLTEIIAIRFVLHVTDVYVLPLSRSLPRMPANICPPLLHMEVSVVLQRLRLQLESLVVVLVAMVPRRPRRFGCLLRPRLLMMLAFLRAFLGAAAAVLEREGSVHGSRVQL